MSKTFKNEAFKSRTTKKEKEGCSKKGKEIKSNKGKQ